MSRLSYKDIIQISVHKLNDLITWSSSLNTIHLHIYTSNFVLKFHCSHLIMIPITTVEETNKVEDS